MPLLQTVFGAMNGICECEHQGDVTTSQSSVGRKRIGHIPQAQDFFEIRDDQALSKSQTLLTSAEPQRPLAVDHC